MSTPILPRPFRGDIWLTDLDPTRGHEQSGRRPALVVSVDPFNGSRGGLAVVLPLTSRSKSFPLHVTVEPPEGGLTVSSFIKTEDVRSVSRERLVRRLGAVTPETLAAVEQRLRRLLGL